MALPNGFFRFPHEFVEAMEPLRQEMKNLPNSEKLVTALEGFVARYMDRDRALEDYLTQVRFNAGGKRPLGFLVAANDSNPVFKAGADYVGNGTSDQVAIQAAIDALVASPTTLFQGVVYLAPGNYTTTAAIDLKGQTIAGASGMPKDANITRSNNGPVIQDGANQYNGFSMVDMGVTSQNSPAIQINNASSFAPTIRMVNCNVGGVGGASTLPGHIYINAPGSSTCSLQLIDCNLGNGGSDNAVVYAVGANSSSAFVSQISGCTLNGGGAYLPGATGVIIYGCNINNGSASGANPDGISLTSAAVANVIIGNTIASFLNGNGITLNLTTETQIIGNRIANWKTTTGDGINVTSGLRDNIMDNVFNGTGNSGINIVSGTNLVVAHNDLLQATGTNRFIDGGTTTTTYAGNRPLAGNATPGGAAGGFLSGTYPNPVFSSSAFLGTGSALTASHSDHTHGNPTESAANTQDDNDVLFWMSIQMGGIH